VCYVAGIVGEYIYLTNGWSWSIAMNMMVAFYAATFPGIVQDLPEVIQSEKEVMEGTREWVPYPLLDDSLIVRPAIHDEFLSYQRAKVSFSSKFKLIV
jgi:hypothetical protein